MSRIHLIGGEKGGVGKSVVARLLAQYWIDGGARWTAFDTDLSHGALLRYYAGYAEPLDVGRLEELDRIMEAACGEDVSVLVDLAAQTARDVHNWAEAGGVLDLAAELGINIYFWHVMDDGKDSVNLLANLIGRYGEKGRYVVVLNRGRGDDFGMFHESPAKRRATELGASVIELKALHNPTMQRIDRLDKSFWAATNHAPDDAGQGLGLMERQRVKVWLRSAFGEFHHLGV